MDRDLTSGSKSVTSMNNGNPVPSKPISKVKNKINSPNKQMHQKKGLVMVGIKHCLIDKSAVVQLEELKNAITQDMKLKQALKKNKSSRRRPSKTNSVQSKGSDKYLVDSNSSNSMGSANVSHYESGVYPNLLNQHKEKMGKNMNSTSDKICNIQKSSASNFPNADINYTKNSKDVVVGTEVVAKSLSHELYSDSASNSHNTEPLREEEEEEEKEVIKKRCLENKTEARNCPRCNFTTDCLFTLSMHILNIHQEFLCLECDAIFQTLDSLNNHKETNHLNVYNCDICSEGEFMTKDLLEKHMINKHGVVCGKCHKSFRNESILKDHLKLMHSNIVKCKFCNDRFSSNVSLNIHMTFKHGQTGNKHLVYQCTECLEIFKNEKELLEHREAKYIYCSKCSRKCVNWYLRSSHMTVLHGKYICIKCAENFESESQRSDYNLSAHENDIKEPLAVAFKCEECGGNFASNCWLRRHTANMHPRFEFKCVDCPSIFKSQDKLNNHNVLMHYFRCKNSVKCKDMLFKSEVLLRRHQQKYHPIRLFQCSMCYQMFSKDCQLRQHMCYSHGIVVHMEKPFRCTVNNCKEMFESVLVLNNHKEALHGIKLTRCIFCNVGYTSPLHWKEHVITAHGMAAFNDSMKQISTSPVKEPLMSPKTKIKGQPVKKKKPKISSKTNRKVHRKNPPETRPKTKRIKALLKCDVCEKTISSKAMLRIHMRTHRSPSEKYPAPNPKVLCDYCGVFLFKTSLKAHQLCIHNIEFLCDKCGTPADTKSALLKCHTCQENEGFRSCNECPKSFRNAQGLKIHMYKAHGKKTPNIKRFICEKCGKSFTNKRGVESHMYMHSGGEKRYQCKYCAKMFHWKQVLRLHERRHTGDKPYSCPICYRRYRGSAALSYHINTHRR